MLLGECEREAGKVLSRQTDQGRSPSEAAGFEPEEHAEETAGLTADPE